MPGIFNTWEDEGLETPIIKEEFDPDRTIFTLSFEKKRRTKQTVKTNDKKTAIKNGDKKTAIKNGDKKVTKKTQQQYDKILEFMEDDKEYRIWDFCELLDLKESRNNYLSNRSNTSSSLCHFKHLLFKGPLAFFLLTIRYSLFAFETIIF